MTVRQESIDYDEHWHGQVPKPPVVVDKYYGLSTDTKPTSPLTGSKFYETDTLQSYVYDGADWQLFRDDVSIENDSTGTKYVSILSDSTGTKYVNIINNSSTETKNVVVTGNSSTETKNVSIVTNTAAVTQKLFDASVYPVKAQGATDGVQYDSTGTRSSGADTDFDLWEFDSYDFFPSVDGTLSWVYYNVSLMLWAGSTSADLKWRLKARDRGSTSWTNMCAEQTETNISTTALARRIEGYLDIQSNITTMPFEMKVVLQSNESSTASGEAIGKVKNDTIIRAVGEES